MVGTHVLVLLAWRVALFDDVLFLVVVVQLLETPEAMQTQSQTDVAREA